MATVHSENGRSAVPRIEGLGSANVVTVAPGTVVSVARSDADRKLEDRLKRLLSAISTPRLEHLGEMELRLELGRLIDKLETEDSGDLDHHDREVLTNLALDERVGFGPIAGFMRESDISEILINGPRQVFVERRGQLQATDVVFRDEEHLLRILRRILAPSGRRFDRKSPMLDMRLPDGSRMNAVLGPPALNGPLVSIR